ncbi:F0F1 ATP synthase subunit B' [Alphaproteobacteria bacterium LSUCC0684]
MARSAKSGKWLGHLGASLVMAGVSLPARAAGGEESGGLPQLDLTTWPTQIFWLIVTFALAYVLMWRIVTPRIASVLEDRHARLDGDMQRARTAADEAEEMRLSYEKQLADARANASEKTRTTLAEAQAEADKKNAAVARKLATKISKAETRIMEARDTALNELDDIAASSAIDAAAALTGIKITKTDAKKAVKAAAKSMPAMMEQ